jgi:hypothetical protein
MAMTYPQFLALYKMKPTAAAAVAWLKSGQAPVGTPIPATLRPQFGGAGSLSPSTPGVDWPIEVTGYSPERLARDPLAMGQARAAMPAPPAMPTPPPVAGNMNPNPGDPYLFPTPQNPFLPQMGALAQQFLTLPQTYNPQRQGVAAGAASQLGQLGLVDFKPGQADYTTELAKSPEGNVTYGVVTGPDGRAYLQAYSSTAHNSATRGVYSGSQVDVQQEEAKRGLDIAKQNILTGVVTGQGTINANQLGTMGELSRSWADYVGRGAGEVAKTVAGWKVPETFSQSQDAARTLPALPTNVGQVPGVTSRAAPQPSPLTQMTGGQRQITGGLGSVTGGVNRATRRAGTGITKPAKSIWDQAKTKTRSTRLAV